MSLLEQPTRDSDAYLLNVIPNLAPVLDSNQHVYCKIELNCDFIEQGTNLIDHNLDKMKKLWFLAFVVLTCVTQANTLLNIFFDGTAIKGGFNQAGKVSTVGNSLRRITYGLGRSSKQLLTTSTRKISSGLPGGATKYGGKIGVSREISSNGGTVRPQSTLTIKADQTERQIASSFASSFASLISWIYGWVMAALAAAFLFILDLGRWIGSWKRWIQQKVDGETNDIVTRQRKRYGCTSPMILVWLGIGIVLTLIEGVFSVIRFFFRYLPWLIGLVLFAVAILYIQDNSPEVVHGIHSATIAGQKLTNTGLGAVNTGKAVMNTVAPMINVNTYSAIQSMRVMYNEFVPKDVQLEGLSCKQTPPPTTSNGRRLGTTIDSNGHVQIWDMSRLLDVARETSYPIILIMFLYGKFTNMVLSLQLLLIHDFIEPLFFILSLIIPKVTCFFAPARIDCMIREIVDFFVTLLVTRAILLLKLFSGGLIDIPIPDIPIGCDERDLGTDLAERIAPMCAGMLWDLEPPGAVYSELKHTSVKLSQDEDNELVSKFASTMKQFGFGGGGGGRRLSAMNNHTKRIELECFREHSLFTERRNGKVIHKGRQLGCPHVRQLLFAPAYERAFLFHRLNHTEDCLPATIHGVRLVSCFYSKDDHPVYVINPVNVTVVISILREVFDLGNIQDYLTFNDSTTTTTESKAEKTTRKLSSVTILTKEQVMAKFQQAAEETPKFLLGSIECNIRTNGPPTSLVETVIDTWCLLSKFGNGLQWKSLGPDLATLEMFFPPPSKNARQLHEQTGPSSTKGLKLLDLGQEFLTLTGSLQKSIRLLTTSTDVKDPSFSRRVLSTVLTDNRAALTLQAFEQSMQSFERHFVSIPATTTAKATNNPESLKGGRRRLATAYVNPDDLPVIQLVGACPIHTYPCANQYQCVPTDRMDLCEYVPPEQATMSQRALQFLQDAASADFDVKGMVAEGAQCWCDYDRDPGTVPFNANLLRVDPALNPDNKAKYCLGLMQPQTTYYSPVPETGILSVVTDLCNGTSMVTTNCVCPFYQNTRRFTEAFYNGLLSQTSENHIINTLVFLQTYVWIFLTGPHALFHPFSLMWTAVMRVICQGSCGDWFIYLFDDMGYDNLTVDRRLTCSVLKLGSVLYTTLLFISIYMGFLLLWPMCEFLGKMAAPRLDRYDGMFTRKKKIV